MDTLHPNDIPTWFSAFCQHPLVFHSLSFTVGVHRQLRSGSSRTLQRTLAHKVRTIQLVNEALLHIESVDTNLEPLILAVTCLWRGNVCEREEPASGNLFDPLLVSSNPLFSNTRTCSVKHHSPKPTGSPSSAVPKQTKVMNEQFISSSRKQEVCRT